MAGGDPRSIFTLLHPFHILNLGNSLGRAAIRIDLLKFVIQGIPIGWQVILLAIGIVLTYKTPGVLNLGARCAGRRRWWPPCSTCYATKGPQLADDPGRGRSACRGRTAGVILDRARFYRHLRTTPPSPLIPRSACW